MKKIQISVLLFALMLMVLKAGRVEVGIKSMQDFKDHGFKCEKLKVDDRWLLKIRSEKYGFWLIQKIKDEKVSTFIHRNKGGITIDLLISEKQSADFKLKFDYGPDKKGVVSLNGILLNFKERDPFED